MFDFSVTMPIRQFDLSSAVRLVALYHILLNTSVWVTMDVHCHKSVLVLAPRIHAGAPTDLKKSIFQDLLPPAVLYVAPSYSTRAACVSAVIRPGDGRGCHAQWVIFCPVTTDELPMLQITCSITSSNNP